MRRNLAFTLASVALFVASVSACTSKGSEPKNELQWKLCGSVECTTLSVPLDWSKPHGDTISLHVSRHRAQLGAGRIGVLVVNPGGPGLPGTSMVSQAPAFLSPDIIRKFDVVSWDPRGTGSSTPQFQCSITESLGLLDTNAAFVAQRAAVDECATYNKRLLPHMSTVDSAHDLNALREALGEKVITFLGYSYGGLLGATWSSMFPTTVRALVLDAPPATNADWQEENASLAARAKILWREYLRTHSSLLTSLDKQTLARAVVASITTPTGRAQLENVLSDSQDLDIRMRMLWNAYLYLTDAGPLNAVAARYATQCSDQLSHAPLTSPPPMSEPTLTPAQLIVMNDFVCGLWPVSGSHVAFSTSTAPTLVVGGVDDAITPLLNAQRLVQLLPHAQLLTVHTDNHTNYMANECSTAKVDAFLTTLVMPTSSTCR